jgi:ribosomal subunit interface protein
MLEPESHELPGTNFEMTVEVAVHDRAHDLTAEDRSYAEKKLAAIVEHFDLVARAELEFDRDLKKRREPVHVVKVTLHMIGHRLPDLRAHEAGRDLRAVVDLLMDKIDGELAELKEKVKPHP